MKSQSHKTTPCMFVAMADAPGRAYTFLWFFGESYVKCEQEFKSDTWVYRKECVV